MAAVFPPQIVFYMYPLPLVLVFVCAASAAPGVTAPTVSTPSGRLRGRYVETRGGRLVQAFFSIPYAQPPVGPLRFQPPQPVVPWSHERLAVTQPLACAQVVDPTSVEDCLYLNIYTHDAKPRNLYPVIVFIPGGSFDFGSPAQYTHEYLMDEDIVLVVLQYRLGLFGFLSTGDEVVPGNMGLKDQRLALRWVGDNIRSFGGDPERVTIYGESDGAVSVHFLAIFTAHEVWIYCAGLFWAAISSSGSALGSIGFRPPGYVEDTKAALAVLSGCPKDSEALVECLRAKPTRDIMTLFDVQFKGLFGDVELNTAASMPLVGGVIEPECVEDRLITGNPWHFNTSTPWMLGVNSKEVLLSITPQLNDPSGLLFSTLNTEFDEYFPRLLDYQHSTADGSGVSQAVREFYLGDLPISRPTLAPFVDAVTDAAYTYIIYEAALRAEPEHTYLYYFDYLSATKPHPEPADARVGVAHTEELLYLFPHPYTVQPIGPVPSDPFDLQVSSALVNMWANFATYRNPTPRGCCEVVWEPFSWDHKFLNISQFEMKMQSPFLPDRMEFWQSQHYPYRDDFYGTPECRTNLDEKS